MDILEDILIKMRLPPNIPERVRYYYMSIDGVELYKYWCLPYDGPMPFQRNFIPPGWHHPDKFEGLNNLFSILELFKRIDVYGIFEKQRINMMVNRELANNFHYSILNVELPVIQKVVFSHGYNTTSAYNQAALRLRTEYNAFYRYVSFRGLDYRIYQLNWQEDLHHMCRNKIVF